MRNGFRRVRFGGRFSRGDANPVRQGGPYGIAKTRYQISNFRFEILVGLVAAMVGALGGCAADTPVAQSLAAAPSTTAPASDPAWPQISKVLDREGVTRDNVYTISIPRDDLDVSIEGMDVPTAAGLESIFWFYRCPCGKLNLVGQFLVADYESNDVIDALRGPHQSRLRFAISAI